MKVEIATVLKTAASSSFIIVSRMIGFFIMGLALNVILLLLLTPEMGLVIGNGGGDFGGSGGGYMVALVVAFVYWPITLMLIGFGAVFPSAYFILGQKHGIAKALHTTMNDNRELIMDYTTNRLWDFVAHKSGLMAGVDGVPGSRVLELLPAYLKKFDNMPRPMRLIARYFIKKIDFGDIIIHAVEQQCENASINVDAFANTVKQKTAAKVEEKLLAPNLKWFAILVSINLVAFVIIKIML